ncbi:hypothetical protein CCUS01_14023 [Colletotrichum cuscutae]|uniref:Uncharacterized protein n=1 Tax=Colletotrichum cuscutae TaxID=1209917 RepID=A0AAJ0DM41_9PEZI|nr:hypothetical protein CCUS01_14023 [Colletotrichum cuscutae]
MARDNAEAANGTAFISTRSLWMGILSPILQRVFLVLRMKNCAPEYCE